MVEKRHSNYRNKTTLKTVAKGIEVQRVRKNVLASDDSSYHHWETK